MKSEKVRSKIWGRLFDPPLNALEPGTVLFEAKDGEFEPL